MKVDIPERALQQAFENCLNDIKLKTGMSLARIIKKQIPQKVEFEDNGYNYWHNVNKYVCNCPSCGFTLFNFDDDDFSYDATNNGDAEESFRLSFDVGKIQRCNNYCPRCGQRLNWKSNNCNEG